MSHLTYKKRIEAEKKGNKDEKPLYKLMTNAVYCKSKENLKKTIWKRLFKMDIKTKLYVTKNI